MEKLRYFIVILLGILIYSCTSHSPLKKYRETKVNANMLDTISYNRLGAYKETAEVTYLFGFIPLNIYGCGRSFYTVGQLAEFMDVEVNTLLFLQMN